jgi:hypothetical protein
MHRSLVDGVPVLHFFEPGPLHTTLRFGVGARDETFRRLGISRLVAALAVHTTQRRLPGGPEPVVSVGVEETRFDISGTAEDVSGCLEALCLALSDPPTEQLDGVARALQDEGVRNVDPRAVGALNVRYGSHAAGLECRKHSWHHLPTADMVLEHAAVWFTRDNAVLTSTGPALAGLRLPLPQGERPRRSAPPARYPRASWAHRDIDGVVLSVEAPITSAATTVAHRILRERVTAALGHRPQAAAMVEETTALYDRGTVVRLLLTSATASDAEATAATVWGQAMYLARKEPAADELAQHRSVLEGTPTRQHILEDAARSELFGTPWPDEEGRRRALETVTPQDVRDSWRRAMDRAQLVVPDGLLLDLAGPDGRRLWCTSCWTWDEMAPWGRVFRAPLTHRVFRPAAQRHWAVLTAESVVVCTAGAYHELRFDEVIALERRGPARNLIGPCGCDVGIDPAWYRGGQQLVSAIDQAVPAELAFDGARLTRLDH